MVQTVMYPVKTAKIATLTADITASDVNLPVDDVTEFLTAPNVINIKSGSGIWERCKYTSVVVTSSPAGYLVIVRSGAEHGSSTSGSALPWSTGAKVYHSVSELHLGTIKGNIEDHETRLAGHVASITNPHLVTAIQTGAATGTTDAVSIYVDKSATGAGTGVDWTNAFTTYAAAIASLPAIIAHAVTIYVRKGSTPYAENATIFRTLAGGSITIRGEYYWQGQNTSAQTGKITLAVDSTDLDKIEVGDTVYIEKYSGTYAASAPSAPYVTTVTAVNTGTREVTVAASNAYTTATRYVITKTKISGTVTLKCKCVVEGLIIDGGASQAVKFQSIENGGAVQYCHLKSGAGATYTVYGTGTGFSLTYSSMETTTIGVYCTNVGTGYFQLVDVALIGTGATNAIVSAYCTGASIFRCSISSGFSIGFTAANNATLYYTQCLNSATTPKSPATSSDCAHIFTG